MFSLFLTLNKANANFSALKSAALLISMVLILLSVTTSYFSLTLVLPTLVLPTLALL